MGQGLHDATRRAEQFSTFVGDHDARRRPRLHMTTDLVGEMVDVDDRLVGVLALSNFKTSRNIRLLRSLLADPGFRASQNIGFGPEGDVRDYVVRDAAFKTLVHDWHISVDPPVVREIRPKAMVTHE